MNKDIAIHTHTNPKQNHKTYHTHKQKQNHTHARKQKPEQRLTTRMHKHESTRV